MQNVINDCATYNSRQVWGRVTRVPKLIDEKNFYSNTFIKILVLSQYILSTEFFQLVFIVIFLPKWIYNKVNWKFICIYVNSAKNHYCDYWIPDHSDCHINTSFQFACAIWLMITTMVSNRHYSYCYSPWGKPPPLKSIWKKRYCIPVDHLIMLYWGPI